jgi:hypothetical protein
VTRIDASGGCGGGAFETVCVPPAAEMGRFVDRGAWIHDTRGAFFATDSQLLVAATPYGGQTFTAVYDGPRWTASTSCQVEGTTPFLALDGAWFAAFSVSPLSSNGFLRIVDLEGSRGWNFNQPSSSPFSATGALSGGTLALNGVIYAYEAGVWSKSTLTLDPATPLVSLGHERFAVTGPDTTRVLSRSGTQWQEVARFPAAQAIALSPGIGAGTRAALGSGGMVRILVNDAAGWTSEFELTPPDDDPEDFGRSLSMDMGRNGPILAVTGGRRIYVYEWLGAWKLLDRIPVKGRAIVRASRLFVYSEDAALPARRAVSVVYQRQ